MNTLDLLCIAGAVAAGIGGYRLGFVRRATGWAGMLGGIALGVALVPRFVGSVQPSGSALHDAPKRLIIGAVVIGIGAIVGQTLGSLVGTRIARSFHPEGSVRRVDAVLGAVAGLIGLVVSLWIVLPPMAEVPGWPSREARSSQVARAIDRTLGSPPGLLDRLGKSVGIAGLPRVFENLQLSPEVDPPPADAPVSPEVLEAGEASTLKVVGEACQLVQTGSGWVVQPGLVVTNAHVVAGTASVRLEDRSGSASAGEVVAFDPDHDLALVSAPSLRAAPLPTGDAPDDSVGVVLGYPEGGPLHVSNYRVSHRMTALGTDIYDSKTVERDMYVLGAELHPGNSGGPMLDTAGRVVGVVFAIAPDRSTVAYAITEDQVTKLLGDAHDEPVPTGPCTA